MIEKIIKIFTEEEIIDALLQRGDETKVRDLIADVEFIRKYINFMLEYEICLDRILEIVQNTTSAKLLHEIAENVFEFNKKCEGFCSDEVDGILCEILKNPHCAGKTIVMSEEKYNFWVHYILFDSDVPEYSKEMLMKIVEADVNGVCFWYITLFKNCDEEIFYLLFEKSRNSSEDCYYDFCRQVLSRNDINRADIIEEALQNFVNILESPEEVKDFIATCHEKYLERVMAKIEENASEEICKEARAAYEERKGGK